MDYLENVPSYDQNENLTSVSQPSSSYWTRHGIMVSALRQVISNSGDDTSSSNLISVDEALPPPDAGPCPLCGVAGCYGCAFQRRHVEIKREKIAQRSEEDHQVNGRQRYMGSEFESKEVAWNVTKRQI